VAGQDRLQYRRCLEAINLEMAARMATDAAGEMFGSGTNQNPVPLALGSTLDLMVAAEL